jgi:hypothetical protein
MNTHQYVLPTSTTVVPIDFVLGIQTMNPSIGHTTIHVNYQTTWLQPITLIILGKTICYLFQHTQCGIMSYFCAFKS